MSGGGGGGTDRARMNICGHVGFPPLKLRGGGRRKKQEHSLQRRKNDLLFALKNK